MAIIKSNASLILPQNPGLDDWFSLVYQDGRRQRGWAIKLEFIRVFPRLQLEFLTREFIKTERINLHARNKRFKFLSRVQLRIHRATSGATLVLAQGSQFKWRLEACVSKRTGIPPETLLDWKKFGFLEDLMWRQMSSGYGAEL